MEVPWRDEEIDSIYPIIMEHLYRKYEFYSFKQKHKINNQPFYQLWIFCREHEKQDNHHDMIVLVGI